MATVEGEPRPGLTPALEYLSGIVRQAADAHTRLTVRVPDEFRPELNAMGLLNGGEALTVSPTGVAITNPARGQRNTS